ncbi:UPF0696 protein C11orf68 homolog isoform X1 [Antedon mediterranea]|uniref:UPF0696 protein C11orf68 homolog isoform X1 n=1 Tax=Antedon mediterranea TaxID=105859 RepID=UPI003AF61F63
MATAGRTHQTFGSDERIFDPECNEETIDDFLFINKPSQLCISDGISWIRVLGPDYRKTHWVQTCDVDELTSSFKKLTHNQSTTSSDEDAAASDEDEKGGVSQNEIFSLDEELTSGKWMIFPKRDYVDNIWGKVAKATVSGKLGKGATMAKVAPVGENEDVSSYIAVYTPDYRNKAQVFDVEKKMRDIGIKGRLKYKPDINTKTGVYRNNEHKVKPSIYETTDEHSPTSGYHGKGGYRERGGYREGDGYRERGGYRKRGGYRGRGRSNGSRGYQGRDERNGGY